MNEFRLADPIVAIASGQDAAARGIVRVSGTNARSVACGAFPTAAHAWPDSEAPAIFEARLPVFGADVPSRWLCFRAPRSYTGEDVVEIHTVGARPLLHEVMRKLVVAGARPAGPGEFSARALRNGRISLEQVGGVLALIQARDAAGARTAARLARGEFGRQLDRTRDGLIDLLARVEAGIDFVDEEGVTFVTVAEMRDALNAPRALLRELSAGPRQARTRETPHVGFFGLPNAGKSTLVNALLGHARVIESPIAGATRDVIAAAHVVGGLRIMLQDTPGLGDSADELDRAAYSAARVAAGEADVVVWVHVARLPWSRAELDAMRETTAGRDGVICLSLCDECEDAEEGRGAVDRPTEWPTVRTSARTGAGLEELERAIAGVISKRGESGATFALSGFADRALAALERLEALLSDGASTEGSAHAQVSPAWELIAMELREALAAIESRGHFATTDEMLGRIFSQFCVGK